MGNGWEVWAALIVGAAVWIVGHLLRQSAEDARRGPARPPQARRPGNPAAPPGRPAPSNELDRFLQEVARRKQQAEQQPRPPAPAKRPTPARSPRRAPEVVPVEPVRRRPSVERPLETVVPPVQRGRRKEEPATVLPVEEVVEVVVPVPAGKAIVAPMKPRQPAGTAVTRLAGMLRTRDDLRAAMILREVLSPPLSRRRGR